MITKWKCRECGMIDFWEGLKSKRDWCVTCKMITTWDRVKASRREVIREYKKHQEEMW